MIKRPAVFISVLIASGFILAFAEEGPQKSSDEHVIVNGDNVEYSADSKEFSAAGNVEINYKGTRLTSDRLRVNTDTKNAQAQGDVRMENQDGVIEGESMVYNFQTKAGIVNNGQFRFSPFFGKADRIQKVSDEEILGKRGYMTTCDYDKPHFRMKYRKMTLYPGEKVVVKDTKFILGQLPLLYMPNFARSLKDPLMHVQFTPGQGKEWGYFLLSAWRFNPTENISWRIYLDYRARMGIAEGFGTNYTTEGMGKGDFKFYYLNERNKTKEFSKIDVGIGKTFQRYLVRWRHKWQMDKRTDMTAEYYKIVDSKMVRFGTQYNILKDFFPREYEKDIQPLSYVSAHHNFNYSALDFILQKRTNRWYSEVEKLPEINYTLPSTQILETPVYFEDSTQVANYNQKYPVPNDLDLDVVIINTANKLSLPIKVFFIQFNPFAKNQITYYNKDAFGASIPPRVAFYFGADLSTKFYRLFDLNTNFLNLNLKGLRHVITPTIAYNYNRRPSVSNTRLKQLGGSGSIARSHSMALELSNKLQTKRPGGKGPKGLETVDLVDLLLTTNYSFQPGAGTTNKRGSGFSDLLLKLKVLPYSWIRVETDATYVHSPPRSQEKYRKFSQANYDVSFDLGGRRSFAFGQRYVRKGSNELVYRLNWQLNPKWKFSFLHRKELGNGLTARRGLREQQYILSRDLHCWTLDINYNVVRARGETLWFVFRLKAFPEMEFDYNREYNLPKSGSQSPGNIE